MVRFVGDRVDLVIAEDSEEAVKKENAPVLHPEDAPDNQVMDFHAGTDQDEVREVIESSDFIFEDKIKISMGAGGYHRNI